MRLEFDKNGLPKPGRLLDAYIAENVMGYTEVHETNRGWIGRYPITNCLVPIGGFSIPAAFFHVMDVAGGQWEFAELDNEEHCGLEVTRHVNCRDYGFCDCPHVYVELDDWSNREAAYAHGVCACVWKAKQKGGE